MQPECSPLIPIARLHLSTLPQRVLLFTGHRVDPPCHSPARFPQSQVKRIKAEIATVLNDLSTNQDDLLLTQGAAGGDLICAQAAAARGMQIVLIQPKEESVFLAESVTSSDCADHWLQVYRDLAHYPRRQRHTIAPQPQAFTYCNQVLLHTALQFGADRLHFIYLWDGKPAAGAGGTAELVEAASHFTKHLYHLHPDPNQTLE